MTARTCILFGDNLGCDRSRNGSFWGACIRKEVAQVVSRTRCSQKMTSTWEVGVRYHMYHAVGLILLGLWGEQRKYRSLNIPAVSFCVGIALFSGLLYALVLTGERRLGAVVPVGGTAFIWGWVMWGWLVFREREVFPSEAEIAS